MKAGALPIGATDLLFAKRQTVVPPAPNTGCVGIAGLVGPL